MVAGVVSIDDLVLGVFDDLPRFLIGVIVIKINETRQVVEVIDFVFQIHDVRAALIFLFLRAFSIRNFDNVAGNKKTFQMAIIQFLQNYLSGLFYPLFWQLENTTVEEKRHRVRKPSLLFTTFAVPQYFCCRH